MDYDLAFTDFLDLVVEKHSDLFSYYVVLNTPPLGWTQGVGFVDEDTIKKYLYVVVVVVVVVVVILFGSMSD